MPDDRPRIVAFERLFDRIPPTLGGDVVVDLLKGAVLKGHDPHTILKKAGIAPEIYGDPDAGVDGREFQRLVNTIQSEMNDLFMGFLEQPAKLALEREQARTRFVCSTLGEAMRASTQFREAVRNDVSYDYIDDPERHEFSLTVSYRTIYAVDRELFHWHRLMMVYRYYSWLIGRRIVLNRASFEGPEPASPDVRRRYAIFDCDVRFGAPHYAITFDKRYLLAPIARKSEAENVDYAVNYPDWFAVPGRGASWARQTEQVVVRLQNDGVWSPTIAMVGAMLSIGARSLRRNLAREGSSFSGIKARVRCELAMAYLMTTDLPVTEIARQVGFGEPGDFTRAFTGWTGTNPSAYRAAHAGDKDLVAVCAAVLRARAIEMR